jgi:hypothetical protein
MAHVFISYSSKDIEYARYIRSGLENAGIPVWMDEAGIKLGEQWIKSLENALDQSVALVVLMSHHSKDSEWVEREIQYAQERNMPIFPILISGKPFFSLINKQYEDMTTNFYEPLPNRLIHALINTLPTPNQAVTFSIDDMDIRDVESDVVILKYAQGFHGADLLVNIRFEAMEIALDVEKLRQEGHLLIETEGAIKAKYVLFVVTPRLSRLDYVGVRAFLIQAFGILQKELPQVETVAMTIHGVGVGLDEGETFRAQMGGILDVLQQVSLNHLKLIQLVEVHKYRYLNLHRLAREYLADVSIAQLNEDGTYLLTTQGDGETLSSVTEQSQQRAITVFFPNDESLEDIYYYGIMRPARMQGFLCENVGIKSDIQEIAELKKLERFIDRAQVVFFYLTDQPISPELAFQMGMVYGKGKKLICLMSADAPSPSQAILNKEFIIKHQRISDLETTILQLLKAIDN